MICKQPYQKRRAGIVHPIQTKENTWADVTPFGCGQCLHCRINQSRIWQTRLLLEAQDCYDSTFLTLTYDDDNVPANFHLDKEHLTLFLKSYRKRLGHKIRYYAVGEYGSETWRPHFHLAIFSEKQLERCIRPCEDMRKRNFCTQDCIPRLAWKKGNISVTPKLTSELAQYITGYIKKKATKDMRINRPNEFATQSKGRRKDGQGGIGFRAIKKIADKFREYPHHDKRVIRSINIGGRSRALGEYLTACLSDELGINESQKQHEFINYSQQLLQEHLENGIVLTNLLESTEGKRNSQEVIYKKFQRKKRPL